MNGKYGPNEFVIYCESKAVSLHFTSTSKQKNNWLALDVLYVYNPCEVIFYEKEAHKFNQQAVFNLQELLKCHIITPRWFFFCKIRGQHSKLIVIEGITYLVPERTLLKHFPGGYGNILM